MIIRTVAKRAKEPFIPVARRETLRQEISSLLKDNELSAKEISAEVGVSEREVYEHLEHLRKTLNKSEYHFLMRHPVCRKCGFVFRKRERLRKPGRCPVCRSEVIEEPLFLIRKI
ncbi:MAG TPA: ArsR family transcriptional regulator [Thermodesulfovibrionales bacterium]|nr:ArsR family transcriptional regulator [Thermodesulfovibrionales bacterium]